MGDVVVTVTDSSGDPVTDAEVTVQQTNHAFLFGCNIFRLGGYDSDKENNRSEEHTSELQSHSDIVCRLLLEKKKKK